MLSHILIYLLAFVGIWIGSGLAIGSVERLSKLLKISSFTVSFLILGLFTSVSELSVGLNSIMADDPEIFVGNLIGASIVMFMLIVPLLAITGNKIRIPQEFQGFNLPASLVVIALPVLFSLDGRIGKRDSLIALILYGILVMIIQSKKSLIERLKTINSRSSIKLGKESLKILFGVATIFIASRFVVEETLFFSSLLNLPPFVLSLLVIAVGTNVPELSLVMRSVFMKSNQVAFGDYIGSAAFNTFLIGALSVLYGKPVLLTNSYLVSLLFLIVGLTLFYFFARSKNTLTRKEGWILLSLYILFLVVEIAIH